MDKWLLQNPCLIFIVLQETTEAIPFPNKTFLQFLFKSLAFASGCICIQSLWVRGSLQIHLVQIHLATGRVRIQNALVASLRLQLRKQTELEVEFFYQSIWQQWVSPLEKADEMLDQVCMTENMSLQMTKSENVSWRFLCWWENIQTPQAWDQTANVYICAKIFKLPFLWPSVPRSQICPKSIKIIENILLNFHNCHVIL